MALIKCPECGNELSTGAITCPKCGFGIAKLREGNLFLKGMVNGFIFGLFLGIPEVLGIAAVERSSRGPDPISLGILVIVPILALIVGSIISAFKTKLQGMFGFFIACFSCLLLSWVLLSVFNFFR